MTQHQSFNWKAWRRSIRPALDEITAADRLADGAGPCRIVFDFELGVELHAGFVGLAGHLLYASFRHVPGFTAGQPGPTFLIQTAGIEQEHPDIRDIRKRMNALAAHEISHFYDHPSLRGWEPTFLTDTAVRDVVLPGLKDDPGNDLKNHAEHGIDHARFIRRSMHIAYRLCRRGHIVPVKYLHSTLAFDEAVLLNFALTDEMDSLADLTIRQVDEIKPPERFTELADRFCGNASQRKPHDEPAAVAAAD